MNFNKSDLRKKYKALRQAEKSSLKDKEICRTLLENTYFRDADTVFMYCSSGTEVDTFGIIQSALAQGKKVALPKCTGSMGMMEFYIISDLKYSLEKGMFSLLEPDIKKCKRAVYSDKSLCVVPGIAFDKAGYRLGYGKGYYDRFLDDFDGYCIGLCYSACLCEKLPFDKFDRKVDMIITENEIIDIK